jgi:hypothetical protein
VVGDRASDDAAADDDDAGAVREFHGHGAGCTSPGASRKRALAISGVVCEVNGPW